MINKLLYSLGLKPAPQNSELLKPLGIKKTCYPDKEYQFNEISLSHYKDLNSKYEKK